MPYELLDLPEPEQEGTLGYLGRTAARTGARAAESIAGLPGDILAGGVDALSYVTGGRTPTHQQLTEKDIARGVPSALQLPTSERIKQTVTQPLTGQYLEPKTPGEESYDKIIGDAAALFNPFAKGNLALKAGKALGLSTAGNLAKWGTESVTGSPLVGETAKLGTLLLSGMFGTRSELNDLKQKSYKDAFAALPEKRKFNFGPELKTIDKAITKIGRSSIPDKAEVLGRLNEFKNISGKRGATNVREAIGIKQGWNEYLREYGDKLAPSAKREIEEAVKTVNSGINRFGKASPDFWKHYHTGEELTAGLRDMNIVGKFIDKHPALKKKIDNPILGSLFKYGIGASTGGLLTQYPAQVGGTVAALYGLNDAAKTLKLMSISPIARSAYADAVKSALKGSVAPLSKDLSRIDEEYHKHKRAVEGKFELLD